MVEFRDAKWFNSNDLHMIYFVGLTSSNVKIVGHPISVIRDNGPKAEKSRADLFLGTGSSEAELASSEVCARSDWSLSLGVASSSDVGALRLSACMRFL